MDNWNRFRLLCRVLGVENPSALAEAADETVIGGLVAAASTRGLLPALAAKLDTAPGRLQALPEIAREPLQSALKQNTRRKLHLQGQAIKIARLLNRAGIEPVFLKGTALMWGGGALPLGSRGQVDIDLLVAPGELRAASEALTADAYRFCKYGEAGQEFFSDSDTAFASSAHHHHLPPMVKTGEPATLELHKHPLPLRFQQRLPLEAVLANTLRVASHGANLRIPHPAIHRASLVWGTWVHDGYSARFDFPLQAGQDYIELGRQEASLNAPGGLFTSPDDAAHRCFEQLVVELMGLQAQHRRCTPLSIGRRLRLMEKRLASRRLTRVLDRQARGRHLVNSLWYNSGKLPSYLQRTLTAK